MINSVALNVVISLVFIYLLYSLLVTTINEIIASAYKLRAKTLKKGIMRMLTDNNDKKNSILDAFYKLPDIKYLAETNKKEPSYLSKTSFAKALIHLCQDLGNINTAQTPVQQLDAGIQKIKANNPNNLETGKYLETLLKDTEGKTDQFDQFQKLIEQWFDETMDRTTGWYKRQNQKITLFVAFVVVCFFNVDTIHIVKNLSINPELAEKIANDAEKSMKTLEDKVKISKDSIAIKKQIENIKTQIDTNIKNTNSLLGLGWEIPKDTLKCIENSETQKKNNCIQLKEKETFDKAKFVLKTIKTNIIGFSLTTLALSLGAPFWFDLLSKVMQLRGSKKPEETPESKTT